MNTPVKSVPRFPGATGSSGRKALFALLGGGAVLAAALGASVYSRSTSDDPVAPPAASAPAAQANEGGASFAPSRALAPHSVYVVASDSEAERTRAAINYGNGILASLGEPLLLASVVVVPSGVPATEVMEAVAEGNRILATLGGPASVVVDLRGPVDSDSSLSAASPDTQFNNRSINYPASREGLRGHIDSDSSLSAVSPDTQFANPTTNYPASREGLRGHIDSD